MLLVQVLDLSTPGAVLVRVISSVSCLLLEVPNVLPFCYRNYYYVSSEFPFWEIALDLMIRQGS